MSVCVRVFHVGARVKLASAQVDEQKTAFRLGTCIDTSEIRAEMSTRTPYVAAYFCLAAGRCFC